MFPVVWDRLQKSIENTRVLHKSNYIPVIYTHLQADNFGIEFQHLYRNRNVLMKKVQIQKPPGISKYPPIYLHKQNEVKFI